MTILVAGASTQSRSRRPLPEGWEPVCVRRGSVSEAWDVRANGKTFRHGVLTWVMDQSGPILGYTSRLNSRSNPVLKYVARAQTEGWNGPASIVSDQEIKAAELLAEIVGPYITDGKGDLRMRWFQNGSDACDAAVRVARAATRRHKIISIGYHGASVIFAHEPQNAGVPQAVTETRVDIDFGDSQALEENIDKAACVILEVPSDDEEARRFLTTARKLCDEHGAILIFDEIVTGFRLALGGAAQYYGTRPDLACYGKAMSNGRPISALIGWPRLMDYLEEKVFYSTTFGGDALNCAHVYGTLSYLRKADRDIYGYIWGLGGELKRALKEVGVPVSGHEPRSYLKFKSEKKRRAFCAAMVEKGICMDRPNYISIAHSSSDVEKTAEAAAEVMG